MLDHAYAQRLTDEAVNINEQMKTLLDRCASEGRSRSAEEQADYERLDAAYVAKKAESDEVLRMLERDAENATARAAFEPLLTPEADARQGAGQASALERYFRTGDTRGLTTTDGDVVVDIREAQRVSDAIRRGADAAEVRALYSDAGTGTLVVPTTFVRDLYQYMEESNSLLAISRIITTDSGEAMTLPRVGTHAIGTQIATQATALAGTDPTFETMTLNAYGYGELLTISNDAIDDAGIDILGFLAENMGRAIGRITATAYATGGGSSAPNGVITAAGTGVKTGGSLVPLSMENLIDLQFSVAGYYADRGAWVMKRETGGTLRKIREDGGTSGAFLWQPSVVAGQPDVLLGNSVYFDSNFASQGSASRSVAFGDWSSFYIRIAGGVRFERSDHYAFNTDGVAFRCKVRTDSDLIDNRAIKTSSQSV